MSVEIPDSSGIPIAICGVGYVYDEKEGSKIGELTFWYSKCEKGI